MLKDLIGKKVIITVALSNAHFKTPAYQYKGIVSDVDDEFIKLEDNGLVAKNILQ